VIGLLAESPDLQKQIAKQLFPVEEEKNLCKSCSKILARNKNGYFHGEGHRVFGLNFKMERMALDYRIILHT
jgi:hypothetical protein